MLRGNLRSFRRSKPRFAGAASARLARSLEVPTSAGMLPISRNGLGRKLLLRSPRGALTRGQVLFGHLTRSFEQIRRLMGVIEAGSLERQSIHLLLHGAHFAPVGRSAKHFRR